MKKLLVLSLMVTMNAFASERVLISDSKETDVELNTSTVRCSAIGYGASELKINVKELDGWTLFDHSNINAGDFQGEPCMTAGRCKFRNGKNGLEIDDILAGSTRVERIKVFRQIVEVKDLAKDENGNDICNRHIQEHLQTKVNRGNAAEKIEFKHTRSGLFETFPASVCQR